MPDPEPGRASTVFETPDGEAESAEVDDEFLVRSSGGPDDTLRAGVSARPRVEPSERYYSSATTGGSGPARTTTSSDTSPASGRNHVERSVEGARNRSGSIVDATGSRLGLDRAGEGLRTPAARLPTHDPE